MMENLPLDTSHPAVKEYLALVRRVDHTYTFWSPRKSKGVVYRLQVLTPLSLLINIATLMVCTFMLDPNLGMSISCAGPCKAC